MSKLPMANFKTVDKILLHLGFEAAPEGQPLSMTIRNGLGDN